MTRIILFATILIGIIGLAVYSGIVKIAIPENLFGRADISSDGFQLAGKINLEDRMAETNLRKDIVQPLSKKTVQKPPHQNKFGAGQAKSVKNLTTVVAKIATTTDTTVAATTTASAPIESGIVIAIRQLAEKQSTATEQPAAPTGRIAISEILVGIDGNANYEFIELYNPNSFAVDLTGWSIKKRNSNNVESTLVSPRTENNFEGKKIMSNKYLLLANKGGYNGIVQVDISWSKSHTLAYTNNAIILYNANGEAIEDIGWDEITKGQSLERVSWSSGEFKIQPNPNPQNSQN